MSSVEGNVLADIRDIANLGSRPKGGSHFFKVASGTRLAHRASGNRRLTGIHLAGNNTVVSTSGVYFNTVNALTSTSDATIIAFRDNNTYDSGWGFIACNVWLPFADDPNLYLYVDNGGTVPMNITFYWDYE